MPRAPAPAYRIGSNDRDFQQRSLLRLAAEAYRSGLSVTGFQLFSGSMSRSVRSSTCRARVGLVTRTPTSVFRLAERGSRLRCRRRGFRRRLPGSWRGEQRWGAFSSASGNGRPVPSARPGRGGFPGCRPLTTEVFPAELLKVVGCGLEIGDDPYPCPPPNQLAEQLQQATARTPGTVRQRDASWPTTGFHELV